MTRQRHVYFVPTRMTQLWVERMADTHPPKIAGKARAYAAHGEMIKNALKIGVPIAFNTDAAVYPHGMNAQEFDDYIDLGMPPAAALMTSSLGAAKRLGVDADTGSLEAPSMPTSSRRPVDMPANIRATEHPLMVMKHGKTVRME